MDKGEDHGTLENRRGIKWVLLESTRFKITFVVTDEFISMRYNRRR